MMHRCYVFAQGEEAAIQIHESHTRRLDTVLSVKLKILRYFLVGSLSSTEIVARSFSTPRHLL